jgi:hypothetical protein
LYKRNNNAILDAGDPGHPPPDASADTYKESLELAKRGLRVLDALPKPPGTTISDEQKSEMSSAFNFAAGSISLRAKNFSDAKTLPSRSDRI